MGWVFPEPGFFLVHGFCHYSPLETAVQVISKSSFLPLLDSACFVAGWFWLVNRLVLLFLPIFGPFSRKEHMDLSSQSSCGTFPRCCYSYRLAVNASCGAGFSRLHVWTSSCIAPEQTPRGALKFSHLSRMGSTILSTRPGLSSTVLLNFSCQVTCPWFSLVIVLVLRSLYQQLGVWWLKGRS